MTISNAVCCLGQFLEVCFNPCLRPVHNCLYHKYLSLEEPVRACFPKCCGPVRWQCTRWGSLPTPSTPAADRTCLSSGSDSVGYQGENTGG